MSDLTEGLRLIAWSLEGGNVLMANDCRTAADALDAAEAKLAAIDAHITASMHGDPQGNFEAGYDEACADIHRIIHPEADA